MPTKRMTKKKDHNRKANRKLLKGNQLRAPMTLKGAVKKV
jgi:hypothetical protein